MQQFYTAESVTEGHPDRLCNILADSVLDACLMRDPLSRASCRAMMAGAQIVVAGEIAAAYKPDIGRIMREELSYVGYDPERFEMHDFTHWKSKGGVDGSDGQGVMTGYACDETPELLPLADVLAGRITRLLTAAQKGGGYGLGPDGRAMVTVEYDEDGKPLRIDSIAMSVQCSSQIGQDALADIVRAYVLTPVLRGFPIDNETKFFIDPLPLPAVDSCGFFTPHTSGALSGRDGTQIVRSGAYMARYIAKNIVAAKLARRCQVTLAYAAGRVEPVCVDVGTFGTGTLCADDCLASAVGYVFPLTPAAITTHLRLCTPRFAQTAIDGHFGRKEYPWERTDKAKALLDAVK